MGCTSKNHLGVVEVREEGASEEVSRGHFPSPLVVDSLVPRATDVRDLLLKEGMMGRQTDYVLDLFHDVPVPSHNNEWAEQGVEL